MKNIVNFSGGKDSTAMLHLMIERGERIDEIIYFDGGWEWPEMREHVEQVEEKTGLKITKLRPENDFNFYFSEYEYKSRKYGGELTGYGWPGVKLRWCTRVKIDTIEWYLKKKYGGRGEIVQFIGFAVGEEARAERKKLQQGNCRFPLIEWNFDEYEAKRYCYRLGYNFGGLYEYFDRVSCWCCPLQSMKELFIKKRHFPEMWARLEEMDARIKRVRREKGQYPPQSYKITYELQQIGERIPENFK